MSPFDVFISHSSTDTVFAESLKAKLEVEKIESWLAAHDIPNGAEWRPEIDEALAASSIVVVVISPASMTSAYVTYEWSYSWFGLDKELYFVYFSECKKDEGMFLRIKQFNLPLKRCLANNPSDKDITEIVGELKKRLAPLPAIKSAGEKLILPGIANNDRMQAARELGQYEYQQARARYWLLQGITKQLNEPNGEVQIEIARALCKVGNARCVPALWKLYRKASENMNREDDYPPARDAIGNALNQLSDSAS